MKHLRIAILPLVLALTGCEPSPIPQPPPQLGDDAIGAFYHAATRSLLADGRLRTETAPADAQFTYADLERNFERIALFDEYTISNGQYIQRETPTYIRRWEGPVTVRTVFGPSTSTAQRNRDIRDVTKFTRQLAGLTGLDMGMTQSEDADIHVLFLSKPEQEAFVPELQRLFPNVGPAVIDSFLNSPINVFCAAFAFAKPGSRGVYEKAIILIKGEHNELMRRSCINEEMAQAMGLSNDSRTARPSIFNDDEEFALLTLHDQILLRMLYDPRLRAGMNAAEVRPLLPQIARDAVGRN